jgi:hypothetical protein
MNKQVLIPVLVGSLLAVSARADYDIVITGSTAFRSVVFDRAQSLYDAGSRSQYTNLNANTITYSGTMSNLFPSFANTKVNLRFSFSGSGAGMIAVNSSAILPTVDLANNSTNSSFTADVALSDVFPSSANLSDSAFDHDVLGVVPFSFFRNNNASGMATVSNITREQAVLLMTASGAVVSGGNVINGMPASFLGGSSTNPVYLVGRDAGSGTRITVNKDIGFTGTPVNWDFASGTPVISAAGGLSSGGTLVDQVRNSSTNAIGYAGLADITALSGGVSKEGTSGNQVTRLTYNGVSCNHSNVVSGQYPIWGYEHIVNRANGLSTEQGQVVGALIAAIKNPNYQSTNAVYSIPFTSLSDMQVERGGDGADITSKNF